MEIWEMMLFVTRGRVTVPTALCDDDATESLLYGVATTAGVPTPGARRRREGTATSTHSIVPCRE